ncbi:MAG: tryptophan tryptophylquinone biosynthesis enzyme MauG [Chitinophagaceae bacterium]|nr:tryptophan tryptophylquinone biosynthesis enzyme MauG [Oligoflexus sp.]
MKKIAFLIFSFLSYTAHSQTLESIRGGYSKPLADRSPSTNPSTPDKTELGKMLFFDVRLSGNNAMSCASCHNPLLGWSDGIPKAIGRDGKQLERRTPSLWNVGLSPRLQWDGAFDELEDQALAPIHKPTEMNQDLKRLPAKIQAVKGYAPLFAKAFPGETISNVTIARALAAFERTILSTVTPFEDFLNGNDNALSLDAKMGLLLFKGKAGCGLCHGGWKFSDDAFYDIGLKSEDRGVGRLANDSSRDFMFKNTRLLEVASHPPYMHDGSLPDLAAVVSFYNRGGDSKRPTVSHDQKPRHLSSLEEAQLVEFLKSLSSHPKTFEIPQIPD